MKTVTPTEFGLMLTDICDRETSLDPDNWTPENPLWGHCAVVSLVAQSLYGGDLMRASLEGTPFAKMGSHYWNRVLTPTPPMRVPMPNLDFTEAQFGPAGRPAVEPIVRTRDYVLSNPKTLARYKLLAYRFARAATSHDAIFDDENYRRCFMAALDSPCQKMRFGCVITHEGKVVYEGPNKTIAPLASMCAGECIRFGIRSRTESMIGSCAHAEEGMWEVVHQGIPISECELYVAGLHMTGLPWLKSVPEHTCLRCATQMHHARLRAIHVPMNGGWARLTTEQALASALAYATGEKKA